MLKIVWKCPLKLCIAMQQCIIVCSVPPTQCSPRRGVRVHVFCIDEKLMCCQQVVSYTHVMTPLFVNQTPFQFRRRGWLWGSFLPSLLVPPGRKWSGEREPKRFQYHQLLCSTSNHMIFFPSIHSIRIPVYLFWARLKLLVYTVTRVYSNPRNSTWFTSVSLWECGIWWRE